MGKAKFLDKEIIQKRRKRMKEDYSDLEKGEIYVDGEMMNFDRRMVQDLFSLMLPISFESMNEDLKNVKYPSKYAPTDVFTSVDLGINIGFSAFTDHMPKEPVIKIAEGIKEALENDQSTFNFQDITVLEVENIDGCYFEFFQNTLDTELFHIMTLIRIKNQILQMTFNCLSELDIVTWKNIVVQMAESITEYEKKGVSL